MKRSSIDSSPRPSGARPAEAETRRVAALRTPMTPTDPAARRRLAAAAIAANDPKDGLVRDMASNSESQSSGGALTAAEGGASGGARSPVMAAPPPGGPASGEQIVSPPAAPLRFDSGERPIRPDALSAELDAISEAASSGPSRWRLVNGLTAVVVCVQAALMVHFAATASITHDEYWHLPVGVLHWRTGQFHWEPLNPPVARAWAALPVALAAPAAELPENPRPAPQYGDEFLRAHPGDFPKWYLAGRAMQILLSLGLSLLLIDWSRRLFGPLGGLLTAISWCFSPSLLAHGALTTTDLAAAAAFAVVWRLLARFVLLRTWPSALALGAALGVAQACKYTCLLLYPLCLVGALLTPGPLGRGAARGPSYLVRWALVLLMSVGVLNACYLGRGSGQPLSQYSFRSSSFRTLDVLLGSAGAIPCPLPRDFLQGLDEQRVVMEQAHPVFLDGVWSESGFGDYYLKTLLYKLPLGVLALAALALSQVLQPERFDRYGLLTAFLLLPTVAVVWAASEQGMQLGVRYILPALPFLSVLIGLAARPFKQPRMWMYKAMVVLAAVAIIPSLRFHPHHLAYFNELAGGPVGGRNHLLDSNLDWGQELESVKRYAERNGVEDIGLAYFGTLSPSVVGLKHHPPPSRRPQPGVYAVSVNFVMGRPHVIHDGQGRARPVDFQEFAYFRFFEPVERLGYAMDIYVLTSEDVARWEQQFAGPAAAPAR